MKHTPPARPVFEALLTVHEYDLPLLSSAYCTINMFNQAVLSHFGLGVPLQQRHHYCLYT